MKSVYGNNLTLTLFGESHGEAIGAVLDGLAPGIPLDLSEIRLRMEQRRGAAALSTARREADEISLVSGYFEGHTTGAPLTILIHNEDTRSADYRQLQNQMRPSHADWAARCKYHGFEDYRGGGHFSGRITAPVVAAGTICRQILRSRGIVLGSHLLRCGGVADTPFPAEEAALKAALERCAASDFPVLDKTAGEAMRQRITEARAVQDSVGGVIETAVVGLEPGLGEPWFWSVESQLSHLLFSIPGVKGVEFGAGFSIAEMTGSTANDPFRYDETGRVITETNRSGGIQGGITNGMPLTLRVAVKPTPSIGREQRTVDLTLGQNAALSIRGRHDPAIVHRARVVVEAAVAFGLVDLAAARYGTDWMAGGFDKKQQEQRSEPGCKRSVTV